MKTQQIAFSFFLGLLLACQSKNETVTVLSVDDTPLIVCDEANVTDEKDLCLSQLVDSLQIIHLDNRDTAFFKFQWAAFSEHYICIWQRDGGAAKLFDKSGKYISDVGAVGQGPGEYRFIYDTLIDEREKCIYLTSFIEKFILKYNLRGEFVEKIHFGEILNKPRLFLNPDTTLSLVHLCFKDRGNTFVAATVSTTAFDSIRYTYIDRLASNFRDKDQHRNGINQEIWSYRNVSDFPFMLTSTDTLYHYNSMCNEIKAHFTLKMDPQKKGDAFFIFNELPHHYLVFIVGGKEGTILIDKESHNASRIRHITADRMGNMDVFPHFQDGYFFDIYEPVVLQEKLKDQLASGNCPENQREKIEALQAALHENDNNILILGKLKE